MFNSFIISKVFVLILLCCEAFCVKQSPKESWKQKLAHLKERNDLYTRLIEIYSAYSWPTQVVSQDIDPKDYYRFYSTLNHLYGTASDFAKSLKEENASNANEFTIGLHKNFLQIFHTYDHKEYEEYRYTFSSVYNKFYEEHFKLIVKESNIAKDLNQMVKSYVIGSADFMEKVSTKEYQRIAERTVIFLTQNKDFVRFSNADLKSLAQLIKYVRAKAEEFVSKFEERSKDPLFKKSMNLMKQSISSQFNMIRDQNPHFKSFLKDGTSAIAACPFMITLTLTGFVLIL